MKNIPVGVKIVLFFLMIVLISGAVGAYQVVEMTRLSNLERDSSLKGAESTEISRILVRVTGVYTVIADAEINRELDQTRKDWEAIRAAAAADIKRVGEVAGMGAEKDAAASFAKLYDDYLSFFENEMMPVLQEKDTVETMAKLRELDGRIDGIRTSVIAPLDAIASSLENEMRAEQASFASTEARSLLIFMILCGAAIVISLVLSLLFARSITRPLARGVAFAQQVATGDFTQRIEIDQKDEVGKLARALETMAGKLRAMVRTIQESAAQVAAASGQITSSAGQLAEGAQTQASSLEETSASMEELSASIEQVAEHAQSQAGAVDAGTRSMAQVQESLVEVARSLAEISDLAGASVEKAVEGARAVEQVVEGIGLIAGSSSRIEGILGVIADIADQTNLLALNASIEAARAGEHGRGFAVVADEVSKLAERSSASTKEIAGLIKESVQNVKRGVETARGSQISMEAIRAGSETVRGMIQALAAAAER